MWASFWANFKPSLRAASPKAKHHFTNSSIRSLGQFKWTRWPYQKSFASLLDKIQTHMLIVLFPTQPAVDEAKSDFFGRRSSNAGWLALRQGRWSCLWAEQVRRWHDHIQRGYDKTISRIAAGFRISVSCTREGTNFTNDGSLCIKSSDVSK